MRGICPKGAQRIVLLSLKALQCLALGHVLSQPLAHVLSQRLKVLGVGWYRIWRLRKVVALSGVGPTMRDMTDFALTRAVDMHAERTPVTQNFHMVPPDDMAWMDTLPDYAWRYIQHLHAETRCEICRAEPAVNVDAY